MGSWFGRCPQEKAAMRILLDRDNERFFEGSLWLGCWIGTWTNSLYPLPQTVCVSTFRPLTYVDLGDGATRERPYVDHELALPPEFGDFPSFVFL